MKVKNKENEAAIVFDDVRFAYAKKNDPHAEMIIDHFSLQIQKGSRTVLFGPSGAGKSTLLKLICKLQKPISGTIQNNAEKISMVFQRDGLFERLSVLENIKYGIPANSVSSKKREQKAQQWARVFKCDDLLGRPVSTLSGGQRQRVSLARAFMKDPDLLLMDESFQGLDSSLKEQLIEEILQLHAKRKFTLILITHSYSEALKLGQTMVLIENGKLQRMGEIWSMINDPSSLFTAGSMGYFPMNLYDLSSVQNISGLPAHLQQEIPEQALWMGFYPWQAEVVYLNPGDQKETDRRLERENRKDQNFLEAKMISTTEAGFGRLFVFTIQNHQIQVLEERKADQKMDLQDCSVSGFRILSRVYFDSEGNQIITRNIGDKSDGLL